VRTDSMEASKWIGDLPQGEARDVAAERLVGHILESDPAAALEWTMTVSDQGHQTDMLRHVFDQWQDRDPQGARASLDTAPVTPEQRNELIEHLNE